MIIIELRDLHMRLQKHSKKVLFLLGNNSCSLEETTKTLQKGVVPFREQQLLLGGNNKNTGKWLWPQ